MRDQFITSLYKNVATNPKIILITGDLGFGVFDKFRKEFPDNFINAGVAEQNMTLVASGLALEGFKVFTYSIGNFSTLRCLEMIRNDICYHNLDVTIVSIGAGYSYGALGMSHHATEDIAIMRALPNLKVYSPCTLREATQITDYLCFQKGPSYLRLDKDPGITDGNYEFVVNKPTVYNQGSNIIIFTTGGVISQVKQACYLLQELSIFPTIIGIHNLNPMCEEEIIQYIKSNDFIFVVEEHNANGGLSNIISSIIVNNKLEYIAYESICIKNVFLSTVGDQNFLRKVCQIDAESIKNTVKQIVE